MQSCYNVCYRIATTRHVTKLLLMILLVKQVVKDDKCRVNTLPGDMVIHIGSVYEKIRYTIHYPVISW